MLSIEAEEFIFEGVGEVTGEQYIGKFKIRPILTFLQKSAADFERRSFLGNPAATEAIDPDIAAQGYILAQIKARVIEGPTWFKETNFLKDLVDSNIAYEIYTKAAEHEVKYKQKIIDKAKKAKEELIQADKTAPKID